MLSVEYEAVVYLAAGLEHVGYRAVFYSAKLKGAHEPLKTDSGAFNSVLHIDLGKDLRDFSRRTAWAVMVKLAYSSRNLFMVLPKLRPVRPSRLKGSFERGATFIYDTSH